ncbi:MAG: flagellar biosynthetic protein FliR [Trichlorobacter sp.]|uniref:flagellar biosynthetic protein FliR n=1 Tax=Trichlorobacter sp. TaxID=2911007 RepID=UPI0025624BC7|nr:flagellar biosynthetic protein FliR [Trichlorobacter sp.]MDK9716759.1 flagellar biosynthetic protein FliR [Trichlorobacter sp.]
MFPFVSPLPGQSDVFLFALVLCRIGGLFAALPLFGGRRLPARIKIVVVLSVTLVCFPILKIVPPPIPGDAFTLGLLVMREMLIGLTLAFITQIIFAAVEFSGQIIGLQMGFSISSVIDPSMGNQMQIMSVMQSLLATLFFLSLNIHHVFIHAIVDSFTVIPLGGWTMSESLIHFLVNATSNVFILGIRLAAPVMVTLLLTSVVLGIMARAFPQMNVFMVSFPLNIGLGFMVLGMTLLLFFHVLELSFGNLAEQVTTVFRLLAKGG